MATEICSVCMFTPTLRQQAIDVMNRVLAHPISFFFKEPLQPDASENYIVLNPIGFNAILDKLTNSEYQDVNSWIRDVEDALHNVEQYYSESSYEAVCARETRRRFNKERMKMQATSRSIWALALQRQKVKLSQYGQTAPQKVKTLFPLIAYVECPPPRTLNYTSHEVQVFMNGMEQMNTEDEYKGLTNVVAKAKKENEEMNDDVLEKARKYVKRCVEKKGKSFE